MEWIAANWWWLSPLLIPLIFRILEYAAKKTKWVTDDRVVTLLRGIWEMSRGRLAGKTKR